MRLGRANSRVQFWTLLNFKYLNLSVYKERPAKPKLGRPGTHHKDISIGNHRVSNEKYTQKAEK